jgi:hypothetical protein
MNHENKFDIRATRQLTSSGIRTLLIIAVASIVAPLAQLVAADHPPTLVEVWSGGDDGLTNRLRDTIESAFKASSGFRLSSGKKPGTLFVTITSNVTWERVNKRTKVSYVVKFTSADSRDVGGSAGSCWDDDLGKCASKILRDARIAAGKIRSP